MFFFYEKLYIIDKNKMRNFENNTFFYKKICKTLIYRRYNIIMFESKDLIKDKNFGLSLQQFS